MNAPLTCAPRDHWRELLDQALENHGGNKNAVAIDLDISRTTVSLVLNNKYPSRLEAFAKRVIEVYDRYECPHLAEPVTRVQCHAHADRDAPTSSPREMRHWRACQSCPRNPSLRSES